MSIWREVAKAELLEVSGGDTLVAALFDQRAFGFVTDGGWALLSRENVGMHACLLKMASDYGDITRPVLELGGFAEAQDSVMGWASLPHNLPCQLPAPWEKRDQWVWMGTRELKICGRGDWALVELDDKADAAEIEEFGLRENPRFEGDPGKGVTRLWLGVRDADGTLIGCGGVHRTPGGMGNLGGFVVAQQYRGRGIGRELLVALSQWMLNKDGLATLSAFADNENALAIYRHAGYKLEHHFQAWSLLERR